MKIAINTIPLLSPLTGAGNYTYHIAKNLQQISSHHGYTYFYGYYSNKLIPPGENPESIYRFKEALRKIPILGEAARNLKDFLNYFSSRKFDLYFEPNFIPIHIPAKRTVVAILDFSFARFPQWHTKEKVRYFQNHFWKKIQRADRIIVISEYIKKEAVEEFRFAENRLTTIPLGFDRQNFKVYPLEALKIIQKQYHLPNKFILFVGSIEPRKNLKGLLQVYMSMKKVLREEFKLVIVGFKGWENTEIMNSIQALEGDVFYTGYVPNEDLGKIYNLAHLFVYPSFYEGFGLPPLEAMACGCPVVVSNAASLPEVCGEAAVYIDPYRVEEITNAIEKVLEDTALRNHLITAGKTRAMQFSWEKSAAEHLRVFEEVASA